MFNIDIHSHYIPEKFISLISQPGNGYHARLIKKDNLDWINHDQGYTYPLLPGFTDPGQRIIDMDKAHIDLAVLSCAPPLFSYWLEPKLALALAQIVNDSIREVVNAYPERFVGMGTVPLNDVELAVEELERCKRDLGFRSVLIGTNVESKQYDEPEFLQFFETCQELDMMVNIHPYYIGDKEMFRKYYLTNLYGNPLDSALAITSLIFGGVFDRVPGLKVCVAHGGGFFPYQLGRLEQGHKMRPEPKINGARSPMNYKDNLYFDSLVFNPKALRFLIDIFGSSRVLLGTDYPFDMGEEAPLKFIKEVGLNPEEKEQILYHNAHKLFL